MTASSELAPGLSTGTWAIDPSHSEISFSVRHLMVSKVRGSFEKFAGSILVGETVEASGVEASIEASSINTRDEGRDQHVRSGDFFDVENHPTWTFKATGIAAGGKGLLISGDLTMRGVTKSVVLDTEFLGVNNDPWGNTKAGFSASTTVNRKDFGIEWNAPLEAGGVLVGEDVNIELEIQAALQK